MPLDPPLGDLVRQLGRVGLRPDPRLVDQILAHGAAARPALLTLASSRANLYSEDLATALGPLHALRLLGELPDLSLVEPLLELLPVEVHSDEPSPPQIFGSEVLQMIGRIGAPALPLLWGIADDSARTTAVRSLALYVIPFVAAYAPETRAKLVDELRQRLAVEERRELATALSMALAELGDAPSYKLIMEGYRSGRIDKDAAPPGAARQFLLGGGRKDLACVRHPLWERYDEHGPHMRADQ